MKIIERIYFDWLSPDGCIQYDIDTEEDEEARQREEDKAMEELE